MRNGNNGGPPQPVAIIEVTLFSNGAISSQVKGPMNRPQLNMMLETARQDLAELYRKKEQELIKVPGNINLPGIRGEDSG